MTEDQSQGSASSTSASSSADSETPQGAEERKALRLETRLARAEAQIHTLQEGMQELYQANRSAKQRALSIRLIALMVAAGVLFYLIFSRGTAS